MLRVLRGLVEDASILPLAAGNLLDLFSEAARVSGFPHKPFFLAPFLDIQAFFTYLQENFNVAPPT